MFSTRKKVEKASLLFEFDNPTRNSLHMFFVPYSIDVLFLNAEGIVVDLKPHFRPLSIYKPKRLFQFVIELPEGVIKSSNTEIGDVVLWK